MKHLKYLKYIIRHKWFVFLAARKIHCSLWLSIVHDSSKFRPSEWLAYTQYFYGDNTGEGLDAIGIYGLAELAPMGFYAKDRFNVAWLHHQNRNKHHYQYWKLLEDSGNEFCLPMPDKYIREMIADWLGAGKAITGKWAAWIWYEKNAHNIQLHPETRITVELYLSALREKYEEDFK